MKKWEGQVKKREGQVEKVGRTGRTLEGQVEKVGRAGRKSGKGRLNWEGHGDTSEPSYCSDIPQCFCRYISVYQKFCFWEEAVVDIL